MLKKSLFVIVSFVGDKNIVIIFKILLFSERKTEMYVCGLKVKKLVAELWDSREQGLRGGGECSRKKWKGGGG